LENYSDSSHPAWYALQAAIFIGSVIAGGLAAMLGPRRSLIVPAALIVLSLLATGFEQFPRPLSSAVVFIWAGGPCLGLIVGVVLVRFFIRDEV
jgi:predicted MFS family arabinose efflux permease